MKLWKVIVVLVVLVAINVLAQIVVCRWDMTDDKRYSISAPTKALLQELDAPLEVSILLDGDLNHGFKRLKKATYEMVEELGVYSGGNWKIKRLSNETIGPLEEELREQLQPIVIHERTHKGQTAQTTVYPYAVMDYIGQTIVIPLLKNQPGLSGEENLNHSIENLEYAIMEGIRTLVQDTVERIAFLEGHGELDEYDVYDITRALARYYQVDRGALGIETGVLDGYKAVIIADPQTDFSEVDKYIIDQYVMQGGRVLWLLNGVQFSKDYLSSQGTTPIVGLDLKLNDMLFRYGVRINHTLVQDLQCLPIPVDVSQDASIPNWQPMPWTYAPLLLTSQTSPITRNVAQVKATMASAVDIVGGDDGIRKEILLATSSASKLTSAPAQVDLSFGHTQDEAFSYSFVPVAVSLEGVFPSVFAHQLPPEGLQLHSSLRKQSQATKQIVVAAGSIIRNDWKKNEPLPLGYDRYTQMQFGNRDFIVNSVLFLTDDQGWMQLRKKEFTLRLINDQRAREMRITAQVISIVIPLVILVLTGGIMIGIRRKKYTLQAL